MFSKQEPCITIATQKSIYLHAEHGSHFWVCITTFPKVLHDNSVNVPEYYILLCSWKYIYKVKSRAVVLSSHSRKTCFRFVRKAFQKQLPWPQLAWQIGTGWLIIAARYCYISPIGQGCFDERFMTSRLMTITCIRRFELSTWTVG